MRQNRFKLCGLKLDYSRYISTSLAESNNILFASIASDLNLYKQHIKINDESNLDSHSNSRLYVEDIDSFLKVREITPAVILKFLKSGRIELSEDEVQLGLESILNVPNHKNDWGGETNDLYTANIVVKGVRRSTAFLLKGKGVGSKEMTIADCGKNGDQIVRLFNSPAEIFVIQYIGPISEAVIQDCEGKTDLRRSQGKNANFLIIDGQDTARLLYAYGKLNNPNIQNG